MNTRIRILSKLNPVSTKTEFEPLGLLEVSLDCADCGKLHRTVRTCSDGPAECPPTGHEFPAQLLSWELRDGVVEVVFEYEFLRFSDRRGRGESEHIPGWVRLHFQTTCHICGSRMKSSVQTNTIRPSVVCCSQCGSKQYQDEEPQIEVLRK